MSTGADRRLRRGNVADWTRRGDDALRDGRGAGFDMVVQFNGGIESTHQSSTKSCQILVTDSTRRYNDGSPSPRQV